MTISYMSCFLILLITDIIYGILRNNICLNVEQNISKTVLYFIVSANRIHFSLVYQIGTNLKCMMDYTGFLTIIFLVTCY